MVATFVVGLISFSLIPLLMHPRIHEVIQLFKEHGHSEYGGEAVTQAEHALQTATLAREAHASPALVAAALLHDVGHLLHQLPDDAPDQGIDDLHEVLAARYLEKYYVPAVTEPVRLHVTAKRYLCTVEPGYFEKLSEPSILSLQLQGGLMHPDEVAIFEANPFAKDAIQLRRWDEEAKDPQKKTPPVEDFADELTHSLAVLP
jgi:[1-hydroxy-2-(trimethylamino)ethyl]phosphonate dioxygenase